MIFTSSAYLTIDDSPSFYMDELVDYLESKSIPAIFYCRGDRLEENMESAVRALKKGFLLANHTYSHKRASEHSADWIIHDIDRCAALLDQAHEQAGIPQKEKYFRFPHIDRGTGGWIVDYDEYAPDEKKALLEVFTDGLNILSMDKPDQAAFDKKDALQAYLKKSGYIQPFKNVSHSWYTHGEIADAADSLFTFSNADWMLSSGHIGKWPYKSLDDLKNKAKNDPRLLQENAVNVILAHDQAGIVSYTIELIDDLVNNGLKFLEV